MSLVLLRASLGFSFVLHLPWLAFEEIRFQVFGTAPGYADFGLVGDAFFALQRLAQLSGFLQAFLQHQFVEELLLFLL